MKKDKERKQFKIVDSMLHVCSTKDLAKEVVEQLNKSYEDRAELQESRSSGFRIRIKSDDDISKSAISDAITNAVSTLVYVNYGDILDYMLDTYEDMFELGDLDNKLVLSIFDYTIHGRLVDIEIDT